MGRPLQTEEFARVCGIEPASVSNLLKEDGILGNAPRNRGEYTISDVFVFYAHQELVEILGATSDRPLAIIREIGERLRLMVANNSVPERIRVRCIPKSGGSTEMEIRVPGIELLRRAGIAA
jgi:hypothetical protein